MKLITLFLPAALTAAVFAQTPNQKGKAQIHELKKALEMFYVDCGHFPSTAEGLQALIQPPPSCTEDHWGPEPYVKIIKDDPWQRLWIYTSVSPKKFELKSYGADGREGGLGEDTDLVTTQ